MHYCKILFFCSVIFLIAWTDITFVKFWWRLISKFLLKYVFRMIRKVLLVNSRQLSSSPDTDLSVGGFCQGQQLTRHDVTQLVFLDIDGRKSLEFLPMFKLTCWLALEANTLLNHGRHLVSILERVLYSHSKKIKVENSKIGHCIYKLNSYDMHVTVESTNVTTYIELISFYGFLLPILGFW